MEYKSRATLFGLPIIHVSTGRIVDGKFKRGIAKGWVAVGDISFGVVLSLGGVAFGGIAAGGLSFGVLAMAGLSVGIYSFGGAAFGVWALGGLAVAFYASIGGAAIATEYALGGVAVAEHMNNPAAEAYFKGETFFIIARKVADHSRWFILLAFIPAIQATWKRIKDKKASAP
jgi:hypothetical protein